MPGQERKLSFLRAAPASRGSIGEKLGNFEGEDCMTDDRELKVNGAWSKEGIDSSRRKRVGSADSKSLRILLVSLLILIFAGGIIYFLSKGRVTRGENLLQLKVTALEQKISELEQQLTDLQGKIAASGQDPALLQQVNALAQKVESLEKQKQPAGKPKAKPSPSSKPAVSAQKKYHTVQKGETLYRISQKYGISVEELRKQNNLPADQPVRAGQKLLVSTGHEKK
jgi:LysM repeat protein